MRIIRGKYGRRRFDVPRDITARPTTDFARENIFNVLENMVDFDDAPQALDLFAGTGAVSFELLSRGCGHVTSIERAPVQYKFIRRVAEQLNALQDITLLRTDAMRYIEAAREPFDIIFADPPYDMPDFDRVAPSVLASRLVKPGTIFVLEHNKTRDYSALPGFVERRVYGSVNFSIFKAGADGDGKSGETDPKGDIPAGASSPANPTVPCE